MGTKLQEEEAQPSVGFPGRLITVKKIAVGSFHSMMLSTTNELYGCGSNCHNQLGIPGGDRCTFERIPLPHTVGSPEKFALSWYCSLIVTDAHELLGAGENTMYQLPVDSVHVAQFECIPTHHVEGGAVLVDASSGFYGSAFVFSNGTVYVTGHRRAHEMEKLCGHIFGVQEKAVQVAHGSYSLLLRTESGAVYSFGASISDRGTSLAGTAPVRMEWPPVKQVWKGGTRSLALAEDGRFFALGSFGRLPFTAPPAPISSLSMGNSHALCILQDGRVMSTGESSYHQLGREVPRSMESGWGEVAGVEPGSVVAVAAASYHSMVLFRDGRVGTFGWNLNFQLGKGRSGGKQKELFIVPGTGCMPWSVVTHRTLPIHIRQSVECVFLVRHVEGSLLHIMPLEVLMYILRLMDTK